MSFTNVVVTFARYFVNFIGGLIFGIDAVGFWENALFYFVVEIFLRVFADDSFSFNFNIYFLILILLKLLSPGTVWKRLLQDVPPKPKYHKFAAKVTLRDAFIYYMIQIITLNVCKFLYPVKTTLLYC